MADRFLCDFIVMRSKYYEDQDFELITQDTPKNDNDEFRKMHDQWIREDGPEYEEYLDGR